MSSLLFGLEFASKLSTSMFAGFATFDAVIAQPARLKCTPREGISHFQAGFRRAAKIQISSALIATGTSLGLYYLKGERHWLIAGSLMSTIIPYTLIVIAPVFKKLLDEKLDKDAKESQELLAYWGSLHNLRSIVSLAALVVIFWNT
jgi:hypothetical protein